MKKIITGFATTLLLLSSTAIQTKAQSLEALYYGSYTQYTPLDVTVDPCNLETEMTFRMRSAMTVENYRLTSNPVIGFNAWKVRCRLFDITTSTEVKGIELPIPGATGDINATTNQDLYNGLANQASFAQGDFTFNYSNAPWETPSGKYLEFNWTVSVHDGHHYAALIEIENFEAKPWGYTSKTVLANEWTNGITINGHHSQNANAWNYSKIQPSFTSMSTGQIAGITWGNNEGYFIGTDNRVYNIVWANNTWNIYCVDWNFTIAAPGGITINPNNGQVYVIGTDGRVYNCVWANNKWNVWCLDWNFTIAAPGGITVNPNNGEVYVIGTDGRIYNCVWANNQWNTWCVDWNFTTAAPGAISVNPSNGEVYVIGTDGRVYNGVWANNTWNVYCVDWNFTQAAPGAITVNTSNGHVYIIGTDGRLYNCVWANNQWNTWCLDWGFTQAAQGAITVNPSSGHVYFIGTDHKLYNAVWANNMWNMWMINNYVYNEYGSIGLMHRTIGNKDYNMVLTKSEQGQLQNHFWLGCLSGHKNGNNNQQQETTVQVQQTAAHIPTGVQPVHSDMQHKFSVHPNPMNNKATVTYSIDKQCGISITLYDIKGTKVKEYYRSSAQPAGSHTLEIEKDMLSAGIYFLTMETDNGKKQVQKLVIQ